MAKKQLKAPATDTGNGAPGHLSGEAKIIWAELTTEYQIEDSAGLKILRTACESFDRAQACRKQIDHEGLMVADRFGQMKPHGLLSIERDNRAAFLHAIKALSLDLEPVKQIGRPPRGY